MGTLAWRRFPQGKGGEEIVVGNQDVQSFHKNLCTLLCFFSGLDLVEEGGLEGEGADKPMGHDGDAGYNVPRFSSP